MNRCLELWREVTARNSGRTAIFHPDGAPARTFDGLATEAVRLSRILPGIEPGSVITLQAPNTPEWIAMLLAIWLADCAALLVDAGMPDSERERVETLCRAAGRFGWGADGAEFARFDGEAMVAEDGIALIKLTSGTSGEPRAIHFTGAQILADCEQICGTMGIGREDLNYGIVAFSHSYGFSNLVTPVLTRGIPLVAATDALPRAVLAGMAASGATVLPAVPAILHGLAGVEGAMPALRLCISAGAPLRAGTAAAFRERFELKVHAFYGASECGGICYDGSDVVVEEGFVGWPLAGVDLRPAGARDGDAFAVEVRSGAVGLRGDSPTLDDGVFRPADWLEGDAVRGYRIVGRQTESINVGGRKVNPARIERTLMECPGVAEAVVFGATDAARTEAIRAIVVCDDKLTEAELRRHCGSRLAAWQVPREIRRVPAIPVDARGKISRRALAAEFG
ncbi:MAG: class I adenylate-forming enzyme family protein [Terrimicrobiaceae bacterium]|nr:class I adenylate-forming enzyme family protein [Terrimicrobiaceae bacterium]